MFFSNLQINYLENKFTNLYEGLEKIDVEGIIENIGKETKYKKQYTIKVQEINGDSKYKNTKLILYAPKNVKLEYGKKVSFSRRI